MRLTSKGQVTIPIEIRRQLGLRPGTEVELVADGEEVRIVRARGAAPRGRDVVEHLRRHGGELAMTTDEIMALTRGEE